MGAYLQAATVNHAEARWGGIHDVNTLHTQAVHAHMCVTNQIQESRVGLAVNQANQDWNAKILPFLSKRGAQEARWTRDARRRLILTKSHVLLPRGSEVRKMLTWAFFRGGDLSPPCGT